MFLMSVECTRLSIVDLHVVDHANEKHKANRQSNKSTEYVAARMSNFSETCGVQVRLTCL